MDFKKEVDYSTLSNFIECKRKFLFQYLLHFRSNKPNIHLIFGSAWHYGLEKAYQAIKENPKISVIDLTEISIKAFNLLWKVEEGQKHFPDEDIIFPKSPGHAANMYYEYWQYYKDEHKDKKIIGIEIPFNIHINDNLPTYIGRQDLCWELPDGVLEIIDHKTSKALWPTMLTTFETSYQTFGYLLSGSLYYDKIPKITYNIALCQKSKIAFHRMTIFKSSQALEQFLFELKELLKDLLYNLSLYNYELETKKDRSDFIRSFPKSPGTACTSFMQPCKYKDICFMRNNPLLWKNKAPMGFTINEWDPKKHENEIKNKIKESGESL